MVADQALCRKRAQHDKGRLKGGLRRFECMGASGLRAMRTVLGVPFRPRPTHIVLFRAVGIVEAPGKPKDRAAQKAKIAMIGPPHGGGGHLGDCGCEGGHDTLS